VIYIKLNDAQRQEIMKIVKDVYMGKIDYQVAPFIIYDIVEFWYNYKGGK
jgi:hypothetical protein